MVYFVTTESGKYVKIGYTDSGLKERLYNIQISNAEKLQVLGVMRGYAKTENELHKKFEHLRVNGEWFELNSDLLDFIEEKCAKDDIFNFQEPKNTEIFQEVELFKKEKEIAKIQGKGFFKNKILRKFGRSFDDYMFSEITENIEDFEIPEIIEFFKEGYSTKSKYHSLLTTFINCVLTQNNRAFMLTRRMFNKVLREDVNNQRYTELSGSVYKKFMASLYRDGIIVNLRESTRGKAGVCEIVLPEIIEYMKMLHERNISNFLEEFSDFEKFQETKKQKILDYYDEKDKKDIKPKKTKEDIKNEIRNKINERFRERQGE